MFNFHLACHKNPCVLDGFYEQVILRSAVCVLDFEDTSDKEKSALHVKFAVNIVCLGMCEKVTIAWSWSTFQHPSFL